MTRTPHTRPLRRPPRWRARIARTITLWLTTPPRTHQTWRYRP